MNAKCLPDRALSGRGRSKLDEGKASRQPAVSLPDEVHAVDVPKLLEKVEELGLSCLMAQALDENPPGHCRIGMDGLLQGGLHLGFPGHCAFRSLAWSVVLAYRTKE